MKNIYLDHAATTRADTEVVYAMLPYFNNNYGNPSSLYNIGVENKSVISAARNKIKELLNLKEGNIYFTSGGTESDNWAIKGIAEAYSGKGNHIITSKIEHHAVLNTCHYLEKKGFKITYLSVDKNGVINLNDLKKAITPKTILISIMYANNEIGTIQDIKKIGKIARNNNVIFHTDAIQAVGHIDLVTENIDLLSMSGHKIYGPKGMGALYVRKGIKISNMLHGGNQEDKKRAGTENVPGIVGLKVALERIVKKITTEGKKEKKLRDYAIAEILMKIPYAKLNGHPFNRLPGNINMSFDFVEGESLILMLNEKGIFTSSGSACTSGSLDPSHVLLAIGLTHERAHGSLRITLGEETTKEEIDILIKELQIIVTKLRAMSPLYEDYIKKGKKKNV